MKKTALLVVFAVLLVSLLIGCGEEIRYMSAPENSDGKIEILNANSQRWTFNINPNGTLKVIASGSIKVYPTDVKNVFLSSERVGYKMKSTVKGTLELKSNSVLFNNLPNNDGVSYYVELHNGKVFEVSTRNFSIDTYEDMYYNVGDNWFEYGNRFETTMLFTRDAGGTTATLATNFGCDTLIGLKESVTYIEGLQVAFVESNGTAHSTSIVKNADGNISFTIGGIPINMEIPTEGRLYLIKPNGALIEFEFNSRNWDSHYVWYAYSEIPQTSLYSDYDEETGNVLIRYYTY